MKKVYSTGPVENAVSNASIGLMIKILNNGASEASAELTLYSLNGKKNRATLASLKIPAHSSAFESFDISSLLQFEAQIEIDNSADVLLSVWGLDADANLNPAHRFTQRELNVIETIMGKKTNLKRKKAIKKS